MKRGYSSSCGYGKSWRSRCSFYKLRSNIFLSKLPIADTLFHRPCFPAKHFPVLRILLGDTQLEERFLFTVDKLIKICQGKNFPAIKSNIRPLLQYQCNLNRLTLLKCTPSKTLKCLIYSVFDSFLHKLFSPGKLRSVCVITSQQTWTFSSLF